MWISLVSSKYTLKKSIQSPYTLLWVYISCHSQLCRSHSWWVSPAVSVRKYTPVTGVFFPSSSWLSVESVTRVDVLAAPLRDLHCCPFWRQSQLILLQRKTWVKSNKIKKWTTQSTYSTRSKLSRKAWFWIHSSNITSYYTRVIKHLIVITNKECLIIINFFFEMV